jgi:hypothetical protein
MSSDQITLLSSFANVQHWIVDANQNINRTVFPPELAL